MRTTKRHGHDLLNIHVAVACFGLAGVLGKMTGLPAPLIVLGRVLYAGCALIVVALARRVPLRPKRWRDIVLLVAQGCLLALHWTAFFQSINVSSVAVGLLSFSSFPLFTAAVEPLVLRSRPSSVQILAAIIVMLGIYLLVPSPSLRDSTTVGVLWGLLAGATFAVLSVMNRVLGREYPSITISLYQDGTAAVVLLPVLVVAHTGNLFAVRTQTLLIMLGLICTALAHTLFIEGMRGVTAQLASLSASLEPVWGILFAALLLHETPGARTLLGGAIIVGATMLPTLIAMRHPRAHPS